MASLGVGVIGCGVISAVYMGNMPTFENIELRACADILPDVAKEKAARFGCEAISVDELLKRDDIDIVLNLTPPLAHFEVSFAALTAGKHVFSEKPLCVGIDRGRVLVAEAKKRNLRIGCAPDTFLGGGGRLSRQTVDEGRIGKILAGSIMLMSHGMEHWHPDPAFFFKYGGGPMLDIGPYYLNALVNLIGPVAHVQGMSSTGFAERVVTSDSPHKGERIAVETPTTVMSLLKFASGVDVTLTMSWDVWKHGHPPIELYGTEGSLRVPDPNFYDGVVETTERDGDWRGDDATVLAFGRPNWRAPHWPASRPLRANYRCLGLSEMAKAIREGTPHRSSGDMALHVLEVMHAVLDAAATGRGAPIQSRVARPAVLSESEAAGFKRGGE